MMAYFIISVIVTGLLNKEGNENNMQTATA